MPTRKRKSHPDFAASDLFERRLLFEYLENLRRNASRLGISKDRLKSALAAAFDRSPAEVRHRYTEIELDFDPSDLTLDQVTRGFRKARTQTRSVTMPEPSGIQRNINAVARYFELDQDTAALFGLIARLLLLNTFSTVWSQTRTAHGLHISTPALEWFSAVADVPQSCVENALIGRGTLINRGLCSVDEDGEIEIPAAVMRLLRVHAKPPEDLTEALIGRVLTAELAWDDFSHLGAGRDLVGRLLGSAGNGTQANLHFMLHGSPGIGKTEFAKALAHRVGMPLIALGESDEDGDEPSRHERIAALRRAGNVLGRGNRKALLLVDEAEDVLDIADDLPIFGMQTSRHDGSKIFLHRLIERFPVPVIWIVNHLHCIRHTVLRRMTYVLEVERPTVAVRRQVWSKALATSAIPATPAELDRLARDFNATPSVAATSARAAALVGGALPEAREIAGSLVKALNGESPPPVPYDAHDYLPELVNVDQRALETLDRIARFPERARPFSLCLYGPPGTGKSAYARHLAARLGLEVVQKRASDLMSKWVGDTEKRIAAAFRDARREGAMLIFDEADSLLRSREMSQARWEVSQVNEMLTWMESHPLPFVCTTNLLDTLDPASLRRFTFKLRFDYLSVEQARRAFAHFFERAAPPELDRIGLLTPADFALARKRAQLGDFVQDDTLVIELLRDESRIKPDNRRSIGFHTA